MHRKNAGFLVCAIAAAAVVVLSLAVQFPGEAQSLSPLQPRWSPLGPDLIFFGQVSSGPITATGRANAVAANPLNRLGDVWVGSAEWLSRARPPVAGWR